MSSSPKSELRLDWCDYKAAKYAVEHWHYSRTMPVSKRCHIGVWEFGKFVGAIVFAWGANPNLSKSFGLQMTECAELVRVALSKHETPVSRLLAVSCRMLRAQSPGLKLLVSYADQREGHHGGIYQGAGWIYTGETNTKFDFEINGKILQRRSYTGKNFGRARMSVPTEAQKVKSPPKHRYLYPLDAAMRAQIAPLAKPYPKRVRSADSGTAGDQPAGGGATPTRTLLEGDHDVRHE